MSIQEEKCTTPRKKGKKEGRKADGQAGRRAGGRAGRQREKTEVSIPAGSQRNELVTSLSPI